MTKQEQIVEMAKVIDKTIRNECVLKTGGCTDCNFLGIDTDEYECQSLLVSTILYKAGYRKILTSDLASDIKREAVKEFVEKLKEKFYYVFGNEYEQSVSGFDTKVLIEHINETLKEYEK